MSIWFNAADVNHNAPIFSKRRPNSAIDMVLIRLGGMSGLSTVSNKQVSAIIRENGTNQWVGEPVGDIIDGGWHHVVLRRTTTDASIWVDGIEQTLNIEANAGTGTQSNVDVPGRNWYIGSNGTASWANAVLDDARIYNRALTDQEILDLYLATGGN
jgi:hypothetical protein